MAGKEESKSGYVKIVWCLPQDIIMLIARVLASFLLSPNSVVGELQEFACSLPWLKVATKHLQTCNGFWYTEFTFVSPPGLHSLYCHDHHISQWIHCSLYRWQNVDRLVMQVCMFPSKGVLAMDWLAWPGCLIVTILKTKNFEWCINGTLCWVGRYMQPVLVNHISVCYTFHGLEEHNLAEPDSHTKSVRVWLALRD